ncbi:MAG: FliI/YscN family ATPase [Candidatus Lindowbacteria bacterium]|nr:FliI/YscN family ATPase [Candidatus Lindowbacteria bacterium]
MVNNLIEKIKTSDSVKPGGVVVRAIGLTVEATGPQAPVGDVCSIRPSQTTKDRNEHGEILAEVVGFKEGKTILMPIGDTTGVAPGDSVVSIGKPLETPVGYELLGRVLDGLGNPIDGKGSLLECERASVFREPTDSLKRPRIQEVLPLGIKAIDGLLTIGRGQRVGIFSGSGVGKSTLLGMMSRFTEADIAVIALVGERGREVRDFIERELGEEGLKRAVVVVATSDQPPLMRIRAAYTATTISEYFRDQGRDVLLMMDSVTRFCRAMREVGLSVGETPGQRSYPPSVFSTLPKLLERAGTSERGSITGLYTVLVDADDMNEPVADNVRGILDGHIVLSRDLAHRNHYPAIDILQSISRLMTEIVDEDQLNAAGHIKELMAEYENVRDMINLGAYVEGADPKVDEARRKMPAIENFLRQRMNERFDRETTLKQLLEAVA